MKWIFDFIRSNRNRAALTIVVAMAAIGGLGYGAYQWYQYQGGDYATLYQVPEEVKGKLVTLRTLREEYFIDYHNAWSRDVRKNLEFPETVTLDYTIRYLQSQLASHKKGQMLLYCVFDNATGVFIGAVQIREKNDSDPGQIGAWINEKYRGGGRYQETLKLLSNIYFRLHPDRTSYIAHVRTWNTASYRAHKKFGFKDVGYFYENGKATRYILEYARPW